MPAHQPNGPERQEEVTLLPAAMVPHYPEGTLGVADVEKPCVFCGSATTMRVHRVPAHGGCWDRSGKPIPVSPSAGPDLQPAPAEATNVAPTDEPAPAQQEFTRRRGNTGPAQDGGFTVDADEELADFHAELCKAARRARRDEPTREQAAKALRRWHEALQLEGEPLRFVSNAGRTGIVAFEWMTARYGAMVMPERLESTQVWDLTASHQVLRVLSFQDTGAPLEEGMHVLETDVHAQYLAAAHSTSLGDGEPTHWLGADGLASIDQVKLTKCPGYVRLASAPDFSGLPPHVQGAFSPLAAGWWLPTPLAAYLVRDCHLDLDLDEAVFWHERRVDGQLQRAYGPRLSRWAKLFIDGRQRLMLAEDSGDEPAGLAVGAVKSCYSTFLGGLLRSRRHNDKDTLRPDWNDQIVAQAGANMLRALDKASAAGQRPLGGLKDAVWWAVDAGYRAPDGLVISTATSERPFQPGKWHLDRRAPVDERLVAAHRSGHAARFLKALIRADEDRAAAEKEGSQ